MDVTFPNQDRIPLGLVMEQLHGSRLANRQCLLVVANVLASHWTRQGKGPDVTCARLLDPPLARSLNLTFSAKHPNQLLKGLILARS